MKEFYAHAAHAPFVAPSGCRCLGYSCNCYSFKSQNQCIMHELCSIPSDVLVISIGSRCVMDPAVRMYKSRPAGRMSLSSHKHTHTCIQPARIHTAGCPYSCIYMLACCPKTYSRFSRNR
jgi:hypothetical protein